MQSQSHSRPSSQASSPPTSPLSTLGLRHVALNVPDPARTKEFYMRVLRMELEWEPDPENIYLTSGGRDNLAIHKTPAGAEIQGPQILDHIGFMLPSLESVDAWHAHVLAQGITPEKEIKTHRDGARSFYFRDCDGVLIQMIFHPPVAKQALVAQKP